MDLVEIIWSAGESFINIFTAALLDNLIEPILLHLYDTFFVFIFITTGGTLGFLLVFVVFLGTFYYKFIYSV